MAFCVEVDPASDVVQKSGLGVNNLKRQAASDHHMEN